MPRRNKKDGPTKGDVAVFWDLTYAYPARSPKGFVGELHRFSSNCGKVRYIYCYIDRPFHCDETQMVEEFKAAGVEVFYCPLNGRKPTIHHRMEADIAFHVALDHPETKTVVFMTGDRDFTYCSETLRNRGVRVEVLVQKKNKRLGWAKGSEPYWPSCLTRQRPKRKENGLPNGGTMVGGKNWKRGGGAVVNGQKGKNQAKEGGATVKGNKKKKKKQKK